MPAARLRLHGLHVTGPQIRHHQTGAAFGGLNRIVCIFSLGKRILQQRNALLQVIRAHQHVADGSGRRSDQPLILELPASASASPIRQPFIVAVHGDTEQRTEVHQRMHPLAGRALAQER